ncbi:unnamed protein product [Lupinus luteus]|uniref:C-22 sterol desaturase n=1 Tax=Lupinus luteus TaxID=3873 RepID=A0AAV1VW32_LUPLU
MITLTPFSITQLTQYFICFILFFILYEQILYTKKKRFIPGPTLVFPFLGNAISLVRNPTKFWAHQIKLARSTNLGISANYISGKFVVFIRDTELSHKVFANVRPDAFLFVGFPFGKKLFGERNIIYMMGQEHKNLRRRIAPNFTPNALSTYVTWQQIIILKHLKTWVKLSEHQGSNPMPIRNLARDLNLDMSETVFLGPYLGPKARESFEHDYFLFNEAFTSFPIDLPRTTFQKGRLAVFRLEKTLATCTEKSKVRMKKGEEPSCLIDYWVQDTLREIQEAKLAGETSLPPFSSNAEIASYLFDFFFAAQDATVSSLLWAVAMLDAHPEVVAKVREEVAEIWSPESNSLITADQLRDMSYTQAVAREMIAWLFCLGVVRDIPPSNRLRPSQHARTMKSSSPITTSDSPRSRLHQIQHPKFLPTKTTSVQKSSSAKPTYSSTFVTPPRTDFYKNVVMPQDDFKQVTYRYQVISFSHPTAKKKYTSVRTK